MVTVPGWPLPPGKPALYPRSPAGFAAPDLDDWQFSYQGLTFGQGTTLETLTVAGISGLPTINSQDHPFPRDTGEYTGEDSMGGRDITIDFQVVGDDIPAALGQIGAAFNAIPYLTQPLWFKLPGYPTLCSMCRPRSRDGTLDVNVTLGTQYKATVTLHANDPRLYAQAQTQAGTDGETITVTNAGNCEVRPVLLFPHCTAGSFENTTIGSNAITALNQTIGGGDTVVVDMAIPHTAIYWPGGITSPTAPLYSVMNWIDRTASTFWTLVPGDNDIQLGLGASGGASAVVWWASAYLF